MYGKSGQDAKEWVQKAIEFYKKTGKAVALAEISNLKGAFVKGEMYVFVLNLKGTMLAHGTNEKYIGVDFSEVRDADGRAFVREILDVANAKGDGFVDYKWIDSPTKENLPKHAYFEKVDDLIFCSGIYEEMWKDLL